MENLPIITIFILLLGFIIKSTPQGAKVMPYFVPLAAVLGAALGGLVVYSADLAGVVQGLTDALVATGLYEGGRGLANLSDRLGDFDDSNL